MKRCFFSVIIFLLLSSFIVCFCFADSGEEEARGIFPTESLFKPLIADPRWPHFSLSYQRFIGEEALKNVASTSFGETFIFYKDYAPFHSNWDIGIQAAVFAIFDLDADSMDLINADYWVCFPISYRKGDLSALLRILHQSSHLGDEYLLGSDVERINLSYESINLTASYDFTEWLRIYAGGSYMISREPSDLEPWSTQYGAELRSSKTFLNNRIKPLAGVDIKNWEENGWNSDISVRAGVQLQGGRKQERKIHFMLEYFKGHSPNGQFYNEPVEFIGLGTHFYF